MVLVAVGCYSGWAVGGQWAGVGYKQAGVGEAWARPVSAFGGGGEGLSCSFSVWRLAAGEKQVAASGVSGACGSWGASWGAGGVHAGLMGGGGGGGGVCLWRAAGYVPWQPASSESLDLVQKPETRGQTWMRYKKRADEPFPGRGSPTGLALASSVNGSCMYMYVE